MQDKERRATEIRRAPLETIVEICGNGADIEPFEAEAVDVSGRGMQLRTAYLPPLEAPLVCRFYHQGREVLVEGVVAWRAEQARGGDFGLKFTAIDKEGVQILQDLCSMPVRNESSDPLCDEDFPRGQRVRLHIDGLNAPLKAAVRDSSQRKLLVGSNLEFLRIGRRLDLEDQAAGRRRGAAIQGVDVTIDPRSGVPQLLVSLRFEHAECTPEPSVVDLGRQDMRQSAEGSEAQHKAPPDEAALERELEAEGERLRGRLGAQAAELAARGANLLQLGSGRTRALRQRAAGGLGRWTKVALTTLQRGRREPAKAVRRTTAPPPGGGFTQQRSRATEGLRAQRQGAGRPQGPATSSRPGGASPRPNANATSANAAGNGRTPPAPRSGIRLPRSRRAAALAGLAGVLLLAVFVVLRPAPGSGTAESPPSAAGRAMPEAEGSVSPSAPSAPPSVKPGAKLAAAPSAPARTRDGIVARVPLFGDVAMAPTEPVPLSAAKQEPSSSRGAGGEAIEAPDETWDAKPSGPPDPESVAAWGRGRLHLPTVYELPLDGPGGGLEGKVEATGFSVFVPDRKVSGDTTAIARRDGRIVRVRTENTPDGARVTFQFRAAVPPYKARLKGSAIQFLISADP